MMTSPLRNALLAATLAACLTSAPMAHAQKAAERFIPLGQSPGLSGQTTLIGIIQTVDPASGSITLTQLEGPAGSIAVTPNTRIWVDRSADRQSSQRGSLQDLTPGRMLEAQPEAGNPGRAEWIKVKPGTP